MEALKIQRKALGCRPVRTKDRAVEAQGLHRKGARLGWGTSPSCVAKEVVQSNQQFEPNGTHKIPSTSSRSNLIRVKLFLAYRPLRPSSSLPKLLSCLPWAQAFSLSCLAAAPLLLPAAARALDFPRTGVVCDAPNQICFDANGASVTQTRLSFGYQASSKLQKQLAKGQPSGGQLAFSSGERCDLQRRTCWDSGSQNATINTSLSQQLFGTGSVNQGGVTGALVFPQTGVVCDGSQQICFDATGASVAQTRSNFGYQAGRNLERQIAVRPYGSEIVFSSGERCNFQRRSCWDNGSAGATINTSLSRQLFGNGSGSWNNGTSGWNGVNQTDNRDASCLLSQRGRVLFNGDCALRQRTSTNGSTAYVVELPNGRRYPFFNRQGQLVLRDSSGTWPAQSSISGNDVRFRWSDLQLVTRPRQPFTTNRYPYPGNNQYSQYPYNQYPYPSNQNPTGSFLQTLFNSLFR